MRPSISFDVTHAARFSERYRNVMVFTCIFGVLVVLMFAITGVSRIVHGGNATFHLVMLAGSIAVFGGLFRWQRHVEDNEPVKGDVVRAAMAFAWSSEAKTLLALRLAAAPHQPLTRGMLRSVARTHVASQTHARKLDADNEALRARYGLQIGNML